MRPRVLCFGGRDYADRERVNAALSLLLRERFLQGFMIIQGGARGADTLCAEWGFAKGFPVVCVPAQWERYKKAAGHLRNGWMLEIQPSFAVGFPGGAGSRDMASQAERAGVPVWLPYGLDNSVN